MRREKPQHIKFHNLQFHMHTVEHCRCNLAPTKKPKKTKKKIEERKKTFCVTLGSKAHNSSRNSSSSNDEMIPFLIENSFSLWYTLHIARTPDFRYHFIVRAHFCTSFQFRFTNSFTFTSFKSSE